MPYWDERVEAMAKHYPEVHWDKQHIDILCARFVLQPERFDVVVGSNLFGDILSDLGPACTGTIGIAPSANLNPERIFPSLFEPVHGSAPDIYGKNIANPLATIWAGAMMLDFLGNGDERYRAAHEWHPGGNRTDDRQWSEDAGYARNSVYPAGRGSSLPGLNPIRHSRPGSRCATGAAYRLKAPAHAGATSR